MAGSISIAENPSPRRDQSQRYILYRNYSGPVLDHRPRGIERAVREEPADAAHRAHLEREAELVVRQAPQCDQIPSTSSRKKNRCSSERVGSSANFPYAEGLHHQSEKTTGRKRTVAGTETHSTTFARTPAEPRLVRWPTAIVLSANS
jgi:hypothetical protein